MQGRNIRPTNKNKIPHGYWELYHDKTNRLYYKCFLVKNKVYGYEIIDTRDALGRGKINMFYYAR
jgi:hypothetical protein